MGDERMDSWDQRVISDQGKKTGGNERNVRFEAY